MSNGDYIVIKAPRGFPGTKYNGRYCYEHVYLYWKKYGILPKRNETIIIHLNKDKHDNRIENLKMVKLAEYTSEERNKKGKGHTQVEVYCRHCGNKFYKSLTNYNQSIKKGQVNFYCSKVCFSYNKTYR